MIKSLLNDIRINPSTPYVKTNNELLYFCARRETLNIEILLLILNHHNFEITSKRLYTILFTLCIEDNMEIIKLLLNHKSCKNLVSSNLIDIDNITEFATCIKKHIDDFDDNFL